LNTFRIIACCPALVCEIRARAISAEASNAFRWKRLRCDGPKPLHMSSTLLLRRDDPEHPSGSKDIDFAGKILAEAEQRLSKACGVASDMRLREGP
jgi:hypothetical protein